MKQSRYRPYLLAALFSVTVHFLMLVCFCLFEGRTLGTVFTQRLTQPGDAVRYLDIAVNGYTAEGENAINLVFYPLYPLLIRLFSCLFSPEISGVLISVVCLAAAGALLYRLTEIECGKAAAPWAVLFFNLYPFSVFTIGVYSESLFLLLTIACMLCIRKDKFIACGVIGLLAALTRVQGMLLLFPAVCQLISRAIEKKNKRKLRLSDFCVLLIPCGFALYLLLNTHLHGNPFQFLLYEAGEPWYQTTQWIGRNITLHAQLAQEYTGLAGIIYVPQIVLYFAAAALLFLGIRQKQSLPLLLYGCVYLGFTYLSGWMISGGRYVLGCFPLFLILARMKDGSVKNLLLVLTAFLFFAYSFFFLHGLAIM